MTLSFDAMLPAFVLPKPNGGEKILGIENFSSVCLIFGKIMNRYKFVEGKKLNKGNEIYVTRR